ncbi:efflux RND transporter periplasmic adaptor subunit [Catellatospora tritici]|uniref:efflux RND transporter periplasmic adaptor subunit n=1 Tax=Catellatospora tritici TaxID=2851566 RepID=UPI0027DFC990|nr:efflux RND transporter periplasmic adaptor subunit [Catellatospora tritici]
MRPLLHRSARPTLLLGTVLLTVSLSAASCDDAPEVTLAAVSRATVTEVVDAPAAVTARAAATLTAPAEGTLAKLAVTPGQQVAKGQVLAVVASPSAQSRLAQAKQALDAAKRSGGGSPSIDLRGAQKHLDKAAAEAFTQARTAAAQIADEQARQALLAQIIAGERGYRQASAAVADAAGAVQRGVASLGSAMKALSAAQRLQAQQAYDLARATVDALTLRAPIPGVVQLGGTSTAAAAPDLSSLLGGLSGGTGTAGSGGTTVPAGVAGVPAVGAPVSAGTAIVTVVDTSELGLVAEVDETDILLVATGIAAEAELDAAPGVAYPATVTAIDVLPTANSRGAVAYRVHLSLGALPAGAPTPRPGMSAVARLQVREAADAVTVPASAVFTTDGHDTVWVRTADGTAERRRVTVGVSGMDTLQITDGLREGEQVVVRGADRVTAGDKLP